MAKYRPRSYVYIRERDKKEAKARTCLGTDCTAEIKARYPGFCPNCKARNRMANDSTIEYSVPASHGLARAREGY